MFLTQIAQESQNSFLVLCFFSLIGLVVNFCLYNRGFFNLKKELKDQRSITFKETALCIFVYVLNFFILTPALFFSTLKTLSTFTDFFNDAKNQMILAQMINIFVNGTIFLFLIVTKNLPSLRLIWKDKRLGSSYSYDVLIGFLTWLIAYPSVIVASLIGELFNKWAFKAEEVDQVAVSFLKSSSSSIFNLSIALFLIVIFAPLIEEFIFRGCMQNYLRKKLGVKFSMILTSLLFAFMHFSLSQKTSNIPLILSLFSFSLYLCFIYEKTRSLTSSIILHSTFNLISSIGILFF